MGVLKGRTRKGSLVRARETTAGLWSARATASGRSMGQPSLLAAGTRTTLASGPACMSASDGLRTPWRRIKDLRRHVLIPLAHPLQADATLTYWAGASAQKESFALSTAAQRRSARPFRLIGLVSGTSSRT